MDAATIKNRLGTIKTIITVREYFAWRQLTYYRHQTTGVFGTMDKRQALLLLLATASLILHGCSRQVPSGNALHPPPDVGALPTDSARVLLGASRPAGTDWLVVDPSSGAAQTVGASASDGELLAVDDTSGEFYFREDAFVAKDSWRNAATDPQRIAPWAPVIGVVHAVWLDADTGMLRVLEMREPSSAEAQAMQVEPPDAAPYWAVLWGFEGNAWKELEKRATSWAADGAVGPAVMDDLRRERGRSARSIRDGSSCVDRLCGDSPGGPPAGFNGEAPEDWRIAQVAGGRLWLGVVLGDTWHVVGPLLFEARGRIPQLLPATVGSAMLIQPNSQQLLISPETPPGAPYVINLDSGSRRNLPESTSIPVWVR